MSRSASNAARLARAPGRLLARVGLIAVLLIGAVGGVIAAAALAGLEREMRPELEREAQVLVQLVAAPLQRALDLGTPFEALTGMAGLLQDASRAQRGIGYVALADTAGTLRAAAGPSLEHIKRLPPREAEEGRLRSTADGNDIALPLHGPDGALVGWLHLGLAAEAVETTAWDIGWDMLIVLLVIVLAAVELLRFAVDRSVIAPLAMVRLVAGRITRGDWSVHAGPGASDEAGALLGRINATVRRLNDRWARLVWLAGEAGAAGGQEARTADGVLGRVAAGFRFGDSRPEMLPPGAAVARLPLVGFVVAEQLSTSFVALYGRELAGPGAAAWLTALPVAIFAAAVAIAAPVGVRFVARHGVRACVLAGAVPVMLGHLGAAFAGSVVQFAAARFLAGTGYAVVIVACRACLAGIALEGRPARSIGGATGTMVAGAVCATAVGAVFADRIGYAATFLLSAMLVPVVVLGTWKTLPAAAGIAGPVWREAGRAFTCLRFSALVLLAAIPARILLTGFILYLAPIVLHDRGLSPAALGRDIMLYGLAMLPALEFGAWLTPRVREKTAMIVAAGILGGAALLLPGFGGPAWTLPAAIALTGFVQGMAAAPMRSLLPSLAAGRFEAVAAPAFLRLGEGIGGVAGPLVAAALIAAGQPVSSIGMFGGFVIVTAAGYGLLHLFTRGRWAAGSRGAVG